MAYRAARMINVRDSTQVVQAWFQGLNPFVDDVSPARLLRDGDIDADGPRVIAAARQFAAAGLSPRIGNVYWFSCAMAATISGLSDCRLCCHPTFFSG